MIRERGLPVDHTTIYRWVQRYAPEQEVSQILKEGSIWDTSCFKSIVEGWGKFLPLKKEGKLTSDEASSPSFLQVRLRTGGALQFDADRLDLGVVFKHFVTHFPTPTRLLVATKGHGRVKHVVAVDPHLSLIHI